MFVLVTVLAKLAAGEYPIEMEFVYFSMRISHMLNSILLILCNVHHLAFLWFVEILTCIFAASCKCVMVRMYVCVCFYMCAVHYN